MVTWTAEASLRVFRLIGGPTAASERWNPSSENEGRRAKFVFGQILIYLDEPYIGDSKYKTHIQESSEDGKYREILYQNPDDLDMLTSAHLLFGGPPTVILEPYCWTTISMPFYYYHY
ncbi:uncharacterized protein LOC132787759 [Drosophila nasuta]|uniref:uncharacterized protein LOC132787759 n=1 Tax=Drosophila nasuta TaxID=42062 RepID=UPI00295F5B1A|nr:uncharacterized protein LOC132787759 [Drosophila nasuta]